MSIRIDGPPSALQASLFFIFFNLNYRTHTTRRTNKGKNRTPAFLSPWILKHFPIINRIVCGFTDEPPQHRAADTISKQCVTVTILGPTYRKNVSGLISSPIIVDESPWIALYSDSFRPKTNSTPSSFSHISHVTMIYLSKQNRDVFSSSAPKQTWAKFLFRIIFIYNLFSIYFLIYFLML